MEELYKDDKIKVECSSLRDYMENYNQTNEPLFAKIQCEFISVQIVDTYSGKDLLYICTT